jgi:ribosome-associated protein
VLDVEASKVLTDAQRARLRETAGPRVTAVAQDARSQARNRELALARLRRKIERGLAVSRPRRATAPTAASRRRHAEAKRRQAQRKRDRRRPAQDDG